MATELKGNGKSILFGKEKLAVVPLIGKVKKYDYSNISKIEYLLSAPGKSGVLKLYGNGTIDIVKFRFSQNDVLVNVLVGLITLFPHIEIVSLDVLSTNKVSHNTMPDIPAGEFIATNNYAIPSSPLVNALKNMHKFWELNPQTHNCNNSPDASPDEYLLYGKVLMLWAYRKCSPLYVNYPVYFMRECHISNPQKLRNSLIKHGYFDKPNIQEIFDTYNMAKLKLIATSIGCKKNGSKSELINRIILCLSPSFISKYVEECNCYSISDKGRVFLENNYDLVELHRHAGYHISLSEYCANRYVGNKKRTFENNIFCTLSTRIFNNCSKRYYYMMKYDYKNLYQIVLSEHRYDCAIDSYLRAVYLDTCCMHEATYCYTRQDFHYLNVFTPETCSGIVELKRFYSPIIIDNIYNDLSLPPSFLSCDEFKAAVYDMLTQISFDCEKYNNIIRERLNLYSILK